MDNLSLIIKHLEDEVAYLQSNLDTHIVEWDFVSAKAFAISLSHKQQQLNRLKQLDNPNYTKINRLRNGIERGKEILHRRELQSEKSSSKEDTHNHVNVSLKRHINIWIQQLSELESEPKQDTIDNDTILSLIEDLKAGRITKIQFSITKSIALHLTITANTAALQIDAKDNNIPDIKLEKLYKIGFDALTLTKLILNFNQYPNLQLVEDLAVIYFEIFQVYGDGEVII